MKIIIRVLGILLVMLLVGLFLLRPRNDVPEMNKFLIQDTHITDYSSEYHFLQTGNDCGPFNVAALTRILVNKEVSSAEFAKTIGWRMPNGYTMPWGLEKQLKENGISVELPNLTVFTDEERINFLHERMSQGKLLVILGAKGDIQHYLSLFGFNRNNDEFYVYDSLIEEGALGFTIDENGSLPGNRTLSSEELLEFWSKGGMYGKFMWYAIVAG